MSQKAKNNLNCLGTIINTHGLKGEVKVSTNSDFIEQRFKKGKKIFYLDENNEYQTLISNGYRMQNQIVLWSIEGLDKIEKVEFLKKQPIYCDKKDVTMKEGEFYLKDVIGFKIVDTQKITLGVVIDTWSNKVYNNFDVRLNNNKIITIPILDNFIKKVDLKIEQIIVELPEGYLD